MVRVSTANMDMSGSLIGSYRVVSLLGKGGIGSVYLAKVANTSTLCALKILLPELMKSSEMRERFGREIENCVILRHPSIVRLLDYGKTTDISYYVMEYCGGGSLRDLMRRNGGVLGAEAACGLICQVLDGLEYAHNVEVPNMRLPDGKWGKGNGLVHRDIKPENILLLESAANTQAGKTYVAKIADFGLAKTYKSAGLSGNTMTGSVGGSLSFISRQQLLNYKYSKPEVDVWSAAAVLYYLLTGKTPRNVETEKNPFNAVLKNKSIPIRKVNPSVPEKLASVLDKALDDSSSLYYKKASDLKEDIVRSVQG